LKIQRVTTEADWREARRIRHRVFIEEQGCPPEEEWDAWDTPEARGQTCHHLLGLVDDTSIATARWRPVEHKGRAAAKLVRFAVLPEWRGRGYGRAMVEAAIREARMAGFTAFMLHAQTYLEALYLSFGFEPVGDVFEEAGIPHIAMVRFDATLDASA